LGPTVFGSSASNEPVVDQIRRFCEQLERDGCQDWQVRQADHALRIYFINFLRMDQTGWQKPSAGDAPD